MDSDYASYPEDLGAPGGTSNPDAADDTPAQLQVFRREYRSEQRLGCPSLGNSWPIEWCTIPWIRNV